MIVARSYPFSDPDNRSRKASFTETRFDGSVGCFGPTERYTDGIWLYPKEYTTSVVVDPDNRVYTANTVGPFGKMIGPSAGCMGSGGVRGVQDKTPMTCSDLARFEEVRVSDWIAGGGVAFHGILRDGALYTGPRNTCDPSKMLRGPVSFFGRLAP